MGNESCVRKTLVQACIIGNVLRFSTWILGEIFSLPLVLIFSLLLLNYCIFAGFTNKKLDITAAFWGSLIFVIMAVGVLMNISFVSLATSHSLEIVYQQNYIIIAIFAEVITGLGILICWKNKIFASSKEISKNNRDLHHFLYFLFFAVVYLLFDSILVDFNLHYWQISLFMAGSCILICFEILLFAFYGKKIIQTAHYEEEYLQLEKERVTLMQREFTLKNLAYLDVLTGAYNRRFLKEMLDSMLLEDRSITVCYIDVNGLKQVNDTLGHSWGDKYLQAAASSINAHLNQADILARIGGDEFVVVSRDFNVKDMIHAMNLANKDFGIRIQEHPASFSFGVIQSHDKTETTAGLLQKSDQKMYIDKIARKSKEK